MLTTWQSFNDYLQGAQCSARSLLMSRGTWVSTTIHVAEVQEREAAHHDSPTTGTHCTFVQSAPPISQ